MDSTAESAVPGEVHALRTVLVANRGEIAVRVLRTVHELGLRGVAVYTSAEASARHVTEADTAVHVDSYLDAAGIVDAARATGADAVHPGYGFLAENADFAHRCASAGLVFTGPPAAAIEAMGDKIGAKNTVAAAGVPVVPGAGEPGMSEEELAAAAERVGFPVLLKPSAGGGGKGMRAVYAADELRTEIGAARREARGAFGDDTLLIERYLPRPRHIEIQVLADAHGNAVHLGERECSLQRRHQKIVEEAPSPVIDDATRQRMGSAAVDALLAVGYTGAGTVEFVVSADDPDEFYFMEANTRLQVEHPVTELVARFGSDEVDLVAWQLRIAAGEVLPCTQAEVRLQGHAVEARVYAEDPAAGFLPTGGTILDLREPSGVRIDSGLRSGDRVGSDYDPMLAKIIAHGADRLTALRNLGSALSRTTILGLGTNIGFLRALLEHPDVCTGRLDTGLVEREVQHLLPEHSPDWVLIAGALHRLLELGAAASSDPWSVPSGWRLGEPAWTPWRIADGERELEVRTRGSARNCEIRIGDEAPEQASAARDGAEMTMHLRGRVHRFRCAREHRRGDSVTWLGSDGHAWALTEHRPVDVVRGSGSAGGPVVSPMPGTVLEVKVEPGEEVRSGQPIAVVEAMKMEHTVTAPVDGTVRTVLVRGGQAAGLGQELAVVEPDNSQNAGE